MSPYLTIQPRTLSQAIKDRAAIAEIIRQTRRRNRRARLIRGIAPALEILTGVLLVLVAVLYGI